MNKRTAATVIVTGSLALLIGGGTASAAWGGPVREDRVPSAVGLARGHVVIRDDLSPAVAQGPISAAVERAASAPEFSADALRELHSATRPSAAVPFSTDALRELHSVAVPAAASSFSAEARRELHSQATATSSADLQGTRLSELAEAMRSSSANAATMQGQRLTAHADAMRELHSGAPATESPASDDDLSPLGSGR
ncbi:hypothetical protein [Agromyces sp. ZXT2-3]|uniref:hypothetical protein n=1 Tax=Agromyces sp. ZXT2-3 TaxID=3461152 RepID=UPI0040552FAC